MERIENAKIISLNWNRERGLTHFIIVEGDGWGCSFGGYHLTGIACYEWIKALMDVLDVEDFNDKTLFGRVIRVKIEGRGGTIKAIGHPTKDKWLCPEELFKKIKEKSEIKQ